MALLDKAKQAAQQALDEAKKGIDTGQAKLDEFQAKRESERLLTALGSAYFAQQRHGGSAEAVDRSADRGRQSHRDPRHGRFPRTANGFAARSQRRRLSLVPDPVTFGPKRRLRTVRDAQSAGSRTLGAL